MWDEIAQSIAKETGSEFSVSSRRSVGGGCINQGYAVGDGARTYFVKLNKASLVAMFEAEALGLQQMLATQTIRVPQPIVWGVAGGFAYIVLEWLELSRGGGRSWGEMGRSLAAMHRAGVGAAFGWEMDNTIGSTPQVNSWTSSWAEFFATHRLGYQFQLARRQRGFFPRQEELLAAVPQLLEGYEPLPCLVHGDLWGGNAAFTAAGEPVIFDPAAYFGDREVDVAMTQLFGGFPPEFYRGYDEVFALDAGYEGRRSLYNLYHVLNHFNLFGGGYAAQANRMIEEVLG